jgi:hypothetical protein
VTRDDCPLSHLEWGGRWDSNPRRPESQSGALPAELRPPSSEQTGSALAQPSPSSSQRRPNRRLQLLPHLLRTDGAPGRARTCDPRLRRPVLYPAELRAHVSSASRLRWSGRRDSNPRPSAPKADALPDCATPRQHSATEPLCARPTARGTANHTEHMWRRQFN